MKFITLDPKRVRFSEDGRYMIVKRVGADASWSGKRGRSRKAIAYELWKYELVAYGFQYPEEAAREAEIIDSTGKPSDRVSATLLPDGHQSSPKSE